MNLGGSNPGIGLRSTSNGSLATWSRAATWVSLAAVVVRPALAQGVPDCAGPNRICEVVPELNVFFKLSDRTRLFLLADVTRLDGGDVTNGELGLHLDYTLKPILRADLRDANWERARYLWMRVGYQRLGNLSGDADAADENRLLLEVTARAELPGSLWLVNRLRLDRRDIGTSQSSRYRYRLGAEREFTLASGMALVAYAQAEGFYDTRFDAWSRRLYQVGVEFELNQSWRLEPYYAYENNTRAAAESVNRFGLVLKYYR